MSQSSRKRKKAAATKTPLPMANCVGGRWVGDSGGRDCRKPVISNPVKAGNNRNWDTVPGNYRYQKLAGSPNRRVEGGFRRYEVRC